MAAIKGNENKWRYHPIVIFTGLVILYTISKSIVALLNL